MMKKNKTKFKNKYCVTYKNLAGRTWVTRIEADSEDDAKSKIEKYGRGLTVLSVKFLRIV